MRFEAEQNRHERTKADEETGRLSKDITAILAGWEHDPDELQVRIIQGTDGRDKIQMRVDLGLIQMELDGRPDGRRIGDAESLLRRASKEAQRLRRLGLRLSRLHSTPTPAQL